MDFMLDEKVNKRNDAAVECARQVFPILDGDGIRRAQRKTAKGPGNSSQ